MMEYRLYWSLNKDRQRPHFHCRYPCDALWRELPSDGPSRDWPDLWSGASEDMRRDVELLVLHTIVGMRVCPFAEGEWRFDPTLGNDDVGHSRQVGAWRNGSIIIPVLSWDNVSRTHPDTPIDVNRPLAAYDLTAEPMVRMLRELGMANADTRDADRAACRLADPDILRTAAQRYVESFGKEE